MSFIYIVSASVIGPSSELIVKMIEAKNKSDAKSIFEAYLVSRFDAAEHVIKDMIVSSLPDLIQERLSINSDVKKVADALALLSNKFKNDKETLNLISVITNGFNAITQPSYTISELLNKMQQWQVIDHNNDSLSVLTYKSGSQRIITSSSNGVILNVELHGFDVVSDDGAILPTIALPSLLASHSRCVA